MNPPKMHISQNISQLLDLTASMLLSAPKFVDKTGYLPFLNLDYVFQELHAGLAHNRRLLGEERYQQLLRKSDQMRALFEADPDEKTGASNKGREMIYEMEDVLRTVKPKA